MRHLTLDVQPFAIGIEDEGAAIRAHKSRFKRAIVLLPTTTVSNSNPISQLNKVRTIVVAS